MHNLQKRLSRWQKKKKKKKAKDFIQIPEACVRSLHTTSHFHFSARHCIITAWLRTPTTQFQLANQLLKSFFSNHHIVPGTRDDVVLCFYTHAAILGVNTHKLGWSPSLRLRSTIAVLFTFTLPPTPQMVEKSRKWRHELVPDTVLTISLLIIISSFKIIFSFIPNGHPS